MRGASTVLRTMDLRGLDRSSQGQDNMPNKKSEHHQNKIVTGILRGGKIKRNVPTVNNVPKRKAFF